MKIYQRIIKPLYTVFYLAPDYEKYIVANGSSCGILLLADHIAPYLSYKADAYNCVRQKYQYSISDTVTYNVV